MKQRIGTFFLCLLSSLCLLANPMEDDFFALKQRFEARDTYLVDELKQYLQTYPYTTYYHDVQMMIGVLQTEKKQYKQALRSFRKVEWKKLGRYDQPTYFFYQGYAFLQRGNTAAAMTCFKTLKESNNPYTLQGKYYYAYCLYKDGQYAKALPDFLALEKTSQYQNIVPYYLIQIYYAQGKRDEVWERAEHLLSSNPDNGNNAEVYRILGELYYDKKDYAQAAAHFDKYMSMAEKQKQTPLRNDLYLMGMAAYNQQEYDRAISYFKQVKQEQDTISESTCLHLGHAYVKTGALESAKLAYSAATSFRLNDKTREEAMYNYALTTHETSTALGESVTAFNDFLREYPATEHATEVYQLLAGVYMNSKNYRAALDAVNAIPKQTRKTAQIKQYLRYQIGVDAFLQGKMQETKRWMTEVITNENQSSSYKTDALYYRAEASYRMHNYEDCYNDLKSFLAQPNNQSANKPQTDYLMGYALFGLKQYSEAEVAFRRYIKDADKKLNTYADALNRIGDCCFNNRAFKDAIAAYRPVMDSKGTGADYATFQVGYAQGLLRQYNAKVTTMEQLVATYPKSDYADDALYEIARANLQDGEDSKAVEAYTRLIDNYPNSNYSRKACLERAMVHRDSKQYEAAISEFKQTIDRYPGSEEAYAALDALEQIYVETNNISEYLAYTKQLGKMKTTATAYEDSLTYVTAELQLMMGNYQAAAAGMTTYLSRFCAGGRYCTVATYQAADCYYRLGNQDEAIQMYRQLMETPGNPYKEESCTRLAELYYDQKNYQEARQFFTEMRSVVTDKEKLNSAELGILRCSYFLNDTEAVEQAATRIIESEDSNDSMRDEARYNRAKIYYNNRQYGQAAVDLTPLSKNVRVVTGAEAAYLLADCYFRLGALDSAESEIMAFASQKTQHRYWLAKSMILLSDINVQRGDLFQAKQYLLSLQNNYKTQDDIQPTITERLAQIEQMESPEVNPETEEDNDDNNEEE
ncbi:MAG: tetratricopeptide repeat protein [Paludibacteraceae bacterium]|nr:tetratricopeptide repeat protein [Paludibacteraceae bacterium]